MQHTVEQTYLDKQREKDYQKYCKDRPRTSSVIKQYDQKKSITQIEEFDDYLIIDGNKIVKPFVEKPFDAEDHNIHIYYNSNEGGGYQKLFRKIGNQSSCFDPNCNSIRTNNENYIYEEFLATNGFDIKVYTVGEFYAHAEARKSPVIDGVVQRTTTGKEVRYPVCLTPEEKLIATKIVYVFGQNVCGFDLLRANGKSYVCDVNGWSFVKGNDKYYQDCTAILTQMILRKLKPQMMQKYQSQLMYFKTTTNNFRPPSPQIAEQQELRSVVSIFRHGDRTPKQKLKLKTSYQGFLQFFEDQKDVTKEIKIKHPKQLQKLLEATWACLSQSNDKDEQSKLIQMRSVLEKGGHFEGINRKAQLKPIGPCKPLPSLILVILKWGGELTRLGEQQSIQLGQFFRNTMYPQDKEGLLRLHSTYRHDLKTLSSDEGRCQNTAAAFLKGFLDFEGDKTPILASMVIKDKRAQDWLNSESEESQVDVLLKKDLYTLLLSDEVLEVHFKQIYPNIYLSEKYLNIIKQIKKPRTLLKEIRYQLYYKVGILVRNMKQDIIVYFEGTFSIYNIWKTIKIITFGQKTWKLRTIVFKIMFAISFFLYNQEEALTLCYKRWLKLYMDFYDANDVGKEFNISKIPDIYDSIKQFKHKIQLKKDSMFSTTTAMSPRFMINLKIFYKQLRYSKVLVIIKTQIIYPIYLVIPFEYGVTEQQKIAIATKIVSPLFEKIKEDLLWWKKTENRFDESFWKYQREIESSEINSPWRHVRTRLYFTSASHMYSLFNLLYYGLGHFLIEDEIKHKQLENILNLHYLSHIVIKLYENLNSKDDDPDRFRLEISVSDGIPTDYPSQMKKYMLKKNQLETIHINESLKLDVNNSFRYLPGIRIIYFRNDQFKLNTVSIA